MFDLSECELTKTFDVQKKSRVTLISFSHKGEKSKLADLTKKEVKFQDVKAIDTPLNDSVAETVSDPFCDENNPRIITFQGKRQSQQFLLSNFKFSELKSVLLTFSLFIIYYPRCMPGSFCHQGRSGFDAMQSIFILNRRIRNIEHSWNSIFPHPPIFAAFTFVRYVWHGYLFKEGISTIHWQLQRAWSTQCSSQSVARAEKSWSHFGVVGKSRSWDVLSWNEIRNSGYLIEYRIFYEH